MKHQKLIIGCRIFGSVGQLRFRASIPNRYELVQSENILSRFLFNEPISYTQLIITFQYNKSSCYVLV